MRITAVISPPQVTSKSGKIFIPKSSPTGRAGITTPTIQFTILKLYNFFDEWVCFNLAGNECIKWVSSRSQTSLLFCCLSCLSSKHKVKRQKHRGSRVTQLKDKLVVTPFSYYQRLAGSYFNMTANITHWCDYSKGRTLSESSYIPVVTIR